MPIQGQMLEVTVIGCNRLKDTETFSRQDPYVCIDYGIHHFRTRTCTDGGRNPCFNQKFIFPLVEGLQEMRVTVLNSNTFFHDDFIASGTIYLQAVLSKGSDGSVWPLQTRSGKPGGEISLLLTYEKPQRSRDNPDAVLPPPPYPPPSPYHPPVYHHPPPFPYPPPYPYPSTVAPYPPPTYAQLYGQPPPLYQYPLVPPPSPPPGYSSAYPPPPGYSSASHAPPPPPHSHHAGYGYPPYY